MAQGYGPDMPWSRWSQGAILVRDGLPWVVSNTDMTIPTAAGHRPGQRHPGRAGRAATPSASREVAGKPQRPLFEETLTRVGGERPLVVGDRLDTDIEGAVTMGWDSLLVLTGVTGLERAGGGRREGQRPTYVAPDLEALAEPQPAPDDRGRAVSLGGWTARRRRRPARRRGRRQRRPTGGGSSPSRPGSTSTRPASLSRPTASRLPGSVLAMTESHPGSSPTTEVESRRVVAPRGLDELPVAEHVAVFERAHESLRAQMPAGTPPRPDPCRRGACGSTPSWCAAAWPARASTPAS